LDEIRSATQSDMGSGSTSSTGGHIPFSPDAKKVLELALRETIRSGDRRIGTQHILLGILRDEKSPGARLLIERGISRKAAEKWIEEI
jgi:ATP-dependent Clp protease ATP-binding subunit ClpA